MHDRRAEREVEQRGHAHAVDEEAGVAGIGAANRVQRERPDICDTPGSDSITRNGSPVVPAVVLASSASTRTAAICGFVAMTVSWIGPPGDSRSVYVIKPAAGTSTGTSAAA